jgi:3-oxoacyl-[acyl-carrier-protein] synthase II
MVAVTGIGLVSPHGDDPDRLFDALMRGESAVRAVFPEFAKPAAAATLAFDESRWFTKLQLPGVDRVSQLAVAAASLALRDAGALDAAPDRIGVYAGCGMGGAAALEAAYASAQRGGRVPPLTVPAFMPNAPAAHVAMRHARAGRLRPTATASCSARARRSWCWSPPIVRGAATR